MITVTQYHELARLVRESTSAQRAHDDAVWMQSDQREKTRLEALDASVALSDYLLSLTDWSTPPVRVGKDG